MNMHLIVSTLILLAVSVLNPSVYGYEAEIQPQVERERKQSPKQTVAAFFHHLTTGESDKAKQALFMPINDQRVASQIDDILPILAKQQKKNGKIHVFDSHTLGNMAIVIYGTEGKGFVDNIDIDPIFLREKDGNWIIIFANSSDDLKKHELPDDVLRKRVGELLVWYEKRELEVRLDWREKKAKVK